MVTQKIAIPFESSKRKAETHSQSSPSLHDLVAASHSNLPTHSVTKNDLPPDNNETHSLGLDKGGKQNPVDFLSSQQLPIELIFTPLQLHMFQKPYVQQIFIYLRNENGS